LYPTIIDVLDELEELLDDPVPSIKLSATLALARIMSYSESLSMKVKERDLVKMFVLLLKDPGSYEKKIGAYALRSLAKHSAELAQSVFDAKGMEGLHSCLSNDDSSVKEIAASALAQLAKYSAEQANLLNQSGVTQQLIECIAKEQEENLKKEALTALTEIAKHDEKLGDSILDRGGAICLVRLISSPNAYIRRQVSLSEINPLELRLFGPDSEAWCGFSGQNSR